MRQKHTYTEELAPRNTGSIKRPARFDMRQTVQVHARTHAAFQKVREMTGMRKDASYADVWEDKMLFAVEHMIWHLRESPTPVKNFIRSLFDPIPKEDYVRNRYLQLQMRFEPTKREAVAV